MLLLVQASISAVQSARFIALTAAPQILKSFIISDILNVYFAVRGGRKEEEGLSFPHSFLND